MSTLDYAIETFATTDGFYYAEVYEMVTSAVLHRTGQYPVRSEARAKANEWRAAFMAGRLAAAPAATPSAPPTQAPSLADQLAAVTQQRDVAHRHLAVAVRCLRMVIGSIESCQAQRGGGHGQIAQ